MKTGDRVRVNIADMQRWQKQVGECLNGKAGTVEDVRDSSCNGFPWGTMAVLVRLDGRAIPNRPSACDKLGFERFWFAPCDLVNE